MMKRILITIQLDDVAPRFDLTSEVLIVTLDADGSATDRKNLVMPSVSAEDLCHFILTEGIDNVICGGIEDEYYQYLKWKKVRVIDSVIGPCDRALELAAKDELNEGAILLDRGKKRKQLNG